MVHAVQLVVKSHFVSRASDRENRAGFASDSDVAVREKPAHKVEVPRRYRVLLHNDDYTTMEFVVMVLEEIFHHPHERAVEIMLDVHRKGIGVAGVYPFDIAETKARKTMELARRHEYPLRCSVEAE